MRRRGGVYEAEDLRVYDVRLHVRQGAGTALAFWGRSNRAAALHLKFQTLGALICFQMLRRRDQALASCSSCAC